MFGVGFLLAWVTAGLVTALVVKRRGHDFRSAAALGVVFGPLFIPLAIQAIRNREDEGPILLSSGRDRGGPVDVLVGLVGPAASAPSVIPILGTLDHRLGRLTLACALDFESVVDEQERARAEVELSCAALFLCDYQPSLVLLPGHPRKALAAHAAEAGYDLLIIVGCSGRRLLPRRARAAGPSGHGGIPMLLVADAPRREQ